MSQDLEKIKGVIKSKLPSEVPIYRTPVTVQLLLIRQTHDYAVFRTEETRELNIAVTPASISDPTQITRVVFLASKQKAPESREFAATVKHYYRKYNIDQMVKDGKIVNLNKPKDFWNKLNDAILGCELKDRLCRSCPRCTLFGAVVTDNRNKVWDKRWNIKHRIEYSSAFSLEPYEVLNEDFTFNAVTESTQSTGQALNVTENVVPLATFPSVVTLVSPTWEELVLVVKNLLKCKSYGAESRTKGDTVNYIMGLVVGNEEIITSLEYTLELSQRKSTDYLESTKQILDTYKGYTAFPDALQIVTGNDLENFVDQVSRLTIDVDFTKKIFIDSINFANRANELGD